MYGILQRFEGIYPPMEPTRGSLVKGKRSKPGPQKWPVAVDQRVHLVQGRFSGNRLLHSQDRYDIFTQPQPPNVKLKDEQWTELQDGVGGKGGGRRALQICIWF